MYGRFMPDYAHVMDVECQTLNAGKKKNPETKQSTTQIKINNSYIRHVMLLYSQNGLEMQQL